MWYPFYIDSTMFLYPFLRLSLHDTKIAKFFVFLPMYHECNNSTAPLEICTALLLLDQVT